MKQFDIYFVNRQINLTDLVSYFYENKITADDLLNYGNNKNYIFAKYNDEERKQYGQADASFVKAGTLLELPRKDRVFVLKFKEYGIEPTNITEAEYVYLSNEVKNYLSKKKRLIDFGENNENLYVKSFNRVYVKIFSRAFNEVIYVTPFMEGISVNVSNAGSFQFSLQGITYTQFDENNIRMNVEKYGNNEYYSKNTLSANEKIKLYFEKVLNPQDLVIIKLEEPFIRGEENFINVDTIDDYDMIGLIDKVIPSINISNEKVEAIVNVEGRDLMKIFIEDGTHFFPIELYAQGESVANSDAKNQFFANPNRIEDDYVARMFGSLNAIETLGNRTVKELLSFITTKLSVLNLDLKNVGNNESFSKNIEEKGIWNFIEIAIDPTVAVRVMQDSSIRTMEGSIINFIKKVLQEPFVEIVTETYGNKFRFIVRTPPTMKETYKNNPTIEVSRKYLIADNTGISDENIYSWYYLRANANMFNDPRLNSFMFPAIALQKYMQIYGSKKLDLGHTYVYYQTNDPQNPEHVKQAKIQNVEDLVWMVKSFAPEQFFKKGTLTFSNIAGIKRGMNLYIPETDMLYYVESYSHNLTVSQKTTNVNVSRGIKLSEIDTYFDLVKIELDRENNSIKDAYLDEKLFERLLKKVY